MKWTEEHITRIATLRSTMQWAEVAAAFKKETGISVTAEACRHTYRLHCTDRELEIDITPELLTEQRRAQVSATKAKAVTKKALDSQIMKADLLAAMEAIIGPLADREPVKLEPLSADTGLPMTAELLFSDLQLGKIGKSYNSKVAEERVKAWTQANMMKILQHQEHGYYFDKIIVAFVGDLIESDKKHGAQSARACDMSTAEQMAKVTELLFEYVIEPLSAMNIPLEVVCITGNHDHDDHGLFQFKPGRNHLSWPMYHAVRLMSKCSGYDHVSFIIPDGCFYIGKIYGHNVLWEHGVKTSCSESSMKSRRNQRAEQARKSITYYRQGDKHNISRFNEDTLVCNGAFFGSDDEGIEYSGINGYAADAGQISFFYVPRKGRRLPLYESFTVQLAHIK